MLKYVGAKSVDFPEDIFVSSYLHILPMLYCVRVCVCTKVSGRLEKSHVTERLTAMKTGVGINWGTAEALAFGTLLHQGVACVEL